ncbi:Ribosomal protein [Trema orientale]|uniref:Small ribosomal subunit protein uS15c n=1 Tax=Trema orientale TaxID=63057 RepID=A0A2P5ELC2_TREOI|nr:Ribosomal protein [Trema orientale]
MALQLILPKRRTLSNPSLIHLFSTTSSPNPGDPDAQTDQSTSSTSQFSSSFFSDVRASLRHQQQQSTSPPQQPPRIPTSPYSRLSSERPPSRVTPNEEIRRNLSEFRRRSAVPPPTGLNPTPSSPSAPDGPQRISFQELSRRNVLDKKMNAEDSSNGGRVSFDAIRESLRQLRPPTNGQPNERNRTVPMSFSAFKNGLRLNPSDSQPQRTTVIGGTGALPASVFGKETREKEDGESSNAMKTAFLRTYSYKDLGEKLRKLRPEAKGEGWFSIEELNDRLLKLREVEEQEAASGTTGIPFRALRESLAKIGLADQEKIQKKANERLDILSQFRGTPDFMKQPPKEHLVEKFFHPDNMSSAEKLKLELAKVRDEFKMSESDCGSARVQVAQLTTKIKHLSTVLHKKDKHSRKGLTAMVQNRKKLLKYLRRTDWDSYCFVLSKLGLRDNPDYKN